MRTSTTRLAVGIVTASLALGSVGFTAGAEPHVPIDVETLFLQVRQNGYRVPEPLADQVRGRREVVDPVTAAMNRGDPETLMASIAVLDAVGAAAIDAIPAVMSAADRWEHMWEMGWVHPSLQLRNVASDVAMHGGVQELAALREFIEYPNLSVRRWALDALELVGPRARDCEPALVSLLDRTPAYGVVGRDYDRVQLLEALAASAPRETAAPRLVAALELESTRQCAVTQLVKIQASRELAAILADGDPLLQLMTADLLELAPWVDASLAPPLREHCRGPDPELRTAAAAALWRHAPGSRESLDVLRTELLTPTTVYQPVRLLNRVGPAATALRPEIRAVLADPLYGGPYRTRIITALTALGAAEPLLLPRLLAIATDAGEEASLRAAAMSLVAAWHGQLPADKQAMCTDALHSALADSNDRVVAAAALRLHDLQPSAPEPLDRLIARLDASAKRNTTILAAIQKWGPEAEPAVPAIVRHFRLSGGNSTAYTVLVRIGPPALPALREFAATADPTVAKRAHTTIRLIERQATLEL